MSIPKIEPCAVCGSTTIDTGKNRQQEAYVNCAECGLTLRLATWNRLGVAVQLLSAVEALGHCLDGHVGRSILLWKIQYGDTWELQLNISDGKTVQGVEPLSAALIALATEVAE